VIRPAPTLGRALLALALVGGATAVVVIPAEKDEPTGVPRGTAESADEGGDLGGLYETLLGGQPSGLVECSSALAQEAETPSAGAPSANPASTEQLVRVTARQVERLRELDFREPVDARFLDGAALGARVRALLRDELSPRAAALEGRVLAMLGAIPAESDLYGLRREALQGQVAGLYVPRTGDLLVLSGEEVGALEKIALAHELEHALADQALGIPLPDEYDPAHADSLIAGTALVEGDATLSMQIWALRHLTLADQLSTLGQLDTLLEQQASFERLPHYLQQELTFPYFTGLGFVCALYEDGGWTAVDRAYRRPPRASVEVIHPERYRAQPADDPSDPGSLPARWQRALRGELGAAQLLWLFEAPGGETARALVDPQGAVAAWGGGELELWTRGDSSALGVSLAEAETGAQLCGAIVAWYTAAFPEVRLRAPAAGEALVADGDRQDAVVGCGDDEVHLGIAPALALARRLAGP
jgi:hypothetical protein